jgi:energy-coupling factor transporter ATP-binding protein EcfA2
MIAIDRLTYAYPGAAGNALHDVTLRLAPGDFALLAGPSGSGKSTLLRSLNGLVPHFSGGSISGRVMVAGQDVIQAGPRAMSRYIGFVFQDPESQTVLDSPEAEIAFALENAAMPADKMTERIGEVLRALDLTPLRNRPLTKLSHGERQKVAIAVALAVRPRVLVLDEPTSQLDPQSAEEMLQLIGRLRREWDLTIVIAEHRLERVAQFANRLVYLEEGHKVGDDPLREGLARVPGSQRPSLVRLGQAMEWRPLPITLAEAGGFTNGIGANGRGVSRESPRQKRQPPASDGTLQVRGLHFSYGGRPVLKGVNLSVGSGEAVVLMGGNGTGKSTLLRCMVGLLSPSQGEVRRAGRSILGRGVAEIARRVAYLPQSPDDLLFAESVMEELLITLNNHRLSSEDVPLLPLELLARLELDELANAYPRDLSVGQRQRVALGAITVTGPEFLLLDEPTRGLDARVKDGLVRLLQGWLNSGMGLLLVTHDVELAAHLADTVMIMKGGEIVAAGPPLEVFEEFPEFGPQVARLFPGRGWLTVDDAVAGIRR